MPTPLFEEGNKLGEKRGPNKISTKVKEAIVGLLENNVDKIQDSFDKLKPEQKLKFIADIIPYAAPKLSSVDTTNEHKGSISIRFEQPTDYIYPTKDESGDGVPESV